MLAYIIMCNLMIAYTCISWHTMATANYNLLTESEENMIMSPIDSLCTIEEAAQALRVSRDTIRRMIKSGELSAIKIRGQWRIHKESINKIVKGE